MWVKNLFPWRPVETSRKHQSGLVCVCVCVWANVCLCDLVCALATQLRLLNPTNNETVSNSKGRDRSSMIDVSLCSVKAVDSYKQGRRSPWFPLMTAALTIYQQFVGDIRKGAALCSFAIFTDQPKQKKSEKKRESWSSSLCILLSHASAHALLSTHIIAAVMELFCLLPSCSFSHPFVLSLPLPFSIYQAYFRDLCLPFFGPLHTVHHSWILPSFSHIFCTYIPLLLSFKRAHFR